MTIKTKYHTLDRVFFIHDNKVHSGQIDYVYTRSFWGGKSFVTEVSYEINGYSKVGRLDESELFPTKEELLKSL